MSENDSRHAHFPCLCVISAVLGVTSGTLLLIAGLGSIDNEDPSEEYRAETHRIFISGAAFAASSLFAGVIGCMPLPSFVSEGIPYGQSDRVVLVDDELQSVLSNNPDDQPPSYRSIGIENVTTNVIRNVPPPSYSSALVANTTGGNENISPPSYETAVSVSSANTLPPSYEGSVSVNRGVV